MLWARVFYCKNVQALYIGDSTRSSHDEVTMKNELGFDPLDYDRAVVSCNQKELATLSKHRSKYVRARVAGNPHTSKATRVALQHDASLGVIGWLIGNPKLTQGEFDTIFTSCLSHDFSCVHIALAASNRATIFQLQQLQHFQKWNIDIALLNNHKGREQAAYHALIKRYLPFEDSNFKEWTELQKLAYFRTYGTRFPNQNE